MEDQGKPEKKTDIDTREKTQLDATPIGLQYFRAVDAFLKDIEPEKGYLNLRVYKSGGRQPSAIILRHVSNLLDKTVDLQDEIDIPSEEKRLQLNAKTAQDGEYLSYPKSLRPENAEFLQRVVNIFDDAVSVDGSEIFINNEVGYVSENGVWNLPPDKGVDKLPPSKPLLKDGL